MIEKEYYTVSEAAKKLGVTTPAVYGYISSKKIKYTLKKKLGKSLKAISKEEILKFKSDQI